MIRVLVVDDSLTTRKVVADRLRRAGLHVVGEASNGREAVQLTHSLRPDVVLMDVLMPVMDGLTATRRIMAEVPTPVVILSAAAHREEGFKTYGALVAGALEVCAKPQGTGADSQADWDAILLIIGAAAQVAVPRLPPRVTGGPAGGLARTRPQVSRPPPTVAVIGASTGGPVAVRNLLASLPADFPVPVIVAIHGSRGLATSLASWLDRECDLRVSEAKHRAGLPSGPGEVLTVPGGSNVTVRGGLTYVTDAENNPGCAPSIDTLFYSVAEDPGCEPIGVLMTGMGADGALGLLAIRETGGLTIAQDKDSCAVFGMPAEAIRIGAAEHVTALEAIPPLMTRLAAPRHAARSKE